jgi:hypothetical protein
MELKPNLLDNLNKQDIIYFLEHFILIIILIYFTIINLFLITNFLCFISSIVIDSITVIIYLTTVIIYLIIINNKLIFTVFNKQDYFNLVN